MRGGFDSQAFAIVKPKIKAGGGSATSGRSAAKKKKSEPIWSEVTKLLPHYSVIYPREITGFFSGRTNDRPKFNTPVAGISDKGARRLGAALNWMILFSPLKEVYSRQENIRFKFKINFITLTLPTPQKHDDHYIKQRLLAPFLKWLERSWNVNSYIWKAEAQDNGNIHFHITTNQFIHWKAIRGKWNRLLAAHGYCKVFQDGTNDKGDAATQVKSVKTMKGIVSYLKGYITKKDVFKKKLSRTCLVDDGMFTKQSYRTVTCLSAGAAITKEYKRGIAGKLWSTSHNLSKIKCFIDMEDDAEYFQARDHTHKGGKVIFEDKFVRVMSHPDFTKDNTHPLIKEKLRGIYDKHFSKETAQTSIEIESFY